MPTLDWIGKDKVVNHHLDVPFRVLDRKYSYDAVHGQQIDDNGSENMIIHGDNLEALKALLPKYEGKIDCIYIDPPYNTGKEGWVYNDNVNDPHMKKWLGEVVGPEGEDLSRHDKWLCMMYPRIKLLHRLLGIDGVIFISIDDNEQHNLRIICDEIFGANNFEGCIHWRRRNNQPNDKKKLLGLVAEYILVYAKDSAYLKEHGVGKIELTGDFSNPDNDPKGAWASKPWKAAKSQGGSKYEIEYPDGQKVTATWLGEKATYEALLADGRIYFPKSRNGMLGSPRKKYYLAERQEEGQCATNWWTHEFAGCNQDASTLLKAIFPESETEKIFETPKPLQLLKIIIRLSTVKKRYTVLDSFAGSGTTAHALLELNKELSAKSNFIMVELMDYADTITAERIKRVISGYGEGDNAVAGTEGSFSYYELGPSLMNGDNLNEEVGLDKIREYIYYTETKTGITESKTDEPSYMGTFAHTAYYFNYDHDAATTLNHDFLETIKTKADAYVIYADKCTLSRAELERYRIVFKKIPRDITRF